MHLINEALPLPPLPPHPLQKFYSVLVQLFCSIDGRGTIFNIYLPNYGYIDGPCELIFVNEYLYIHLN